MKIWKCPNCNWEEHAHPTYGWQRHNAHAVHTHQTQLCPALKNTITHYEVVVSTDNGTSTQTAAHLDHARIFFDQACNETSPGRIVIIINPIYS